MQTHDMLIQDLTDMLRVNQERALNYNSSAYHCGDLQLKTLLHRELDNAWDTGIAIKRLLIDHFELPDTNSEDTGQVYSLWKDFSPSFGEGDLRVELQAFEMSDLLQLRCYALLLSRPYLDVITKNLIEYFNENSKALYKSVKNFRENYTNLLNIAHSQYYSMNITQGTASAVHY